MRVCREDYSLSSYLSFGADGTFTHRILQSVWNSGSTISFGCIINISPSLK